ncbi:hypothetical protein BUE76_00185 [Cnuella takakiae]|nr:hypothetical protein BUE76_00185 [Cnuella takakiae]
MNGLKAFVKVAGYRTWQSIHTQAGGLSWLVFILMATAAIIRIKTWQLTASGATFYTIAGSMCTAAAMAGRFGIKQELYLKWLK